MSQPTILNALTFSFAVSLITLPLTAFLAAFGTGVGHINKVKLRRARLVLGSVTTFGGSAILVVVVVVVGCRG